MDLSNIDMKKPNEMNELIKNKNGSFPILHSQHAMFPALVGTST